MAKSNIIKAAEIIAKSKYLVAFTGAGISIESGIPAFRGENGLWSKYDPGILDLDLYIDTPEKSWGIIKKLFFDFFGKADPNPAHAGLSELQKSGFLKSIITQNIDNLHQKSGSKNVIEFHGTSERFVCLQCHATYETIKLKLEEEPPRCSKCFGTLKPDFIFFGEGIPGEAYKKSFEEVRKADVLLIIGTTGEIMPASTLPFEAGRNKATIIEINPEESNYTNNITNIHLKGKAGLLIPEISRAVRLIKRMA